MPSDHRPGLVEVGHATVPCGPLAPSLARTAVARWLDSRGHPELPLEPVAPNYPGEVVERWRYRDGSGEIGVIASVTRPFCGACTRARLSADGKFFTCLFAIKGHDLRAPLRDGASDAEISAGIGAIWRLRNDRCSELRTAETAALPKVEMSYIGGYADRLWACRPAVVEGLWSTARALRGVRQVEDRALGRDRTCRAPTMPNGMRWVGLDVHAHASAAAVFDDVTGEVVTRRVNGRPMDCSTVA